MKYKGNTPVKAGDKVHLTAYEKDGKVVDVLASQFTVRIGKKVRFFYYADKGDTWTRTSQGK